MKKFFVSLSLLALGSSCWAGSAEYPKGVKVESILQTTKDAAGQALVYPRTDDPQVTAVMVEIPPGTETGWHKHPFPCYGYVFSGSLSIKMEGGKVKKLSGGQAFVESVNVLHNGRNTGADAVRLVMFVMGEKGKPFTVRAHH